MQAAETHAITPAVRSRRRRDRDLRHNLAIEITRRRGTRERVVTSGTKARMYVHRAESGHVLVAGLGAVLAEPSDDPFVGSSQ